MSENNEANPVGYKKPPMHTRFKKGQTGNRAGRPKGRVKRADLLAAFEEALDALVAINDNGRRSKRRKLNVLAAQTVNDALKGDRDARKIVVAVATRKATGVEQVEEVSGQTAEEIKKELNEVFDEIARKLGAGGDADASDSQAIPSAKNDQEGAVARAPKLKDAS